jgi:F1F0 ATPase subunit 2
MLMNEMLILVFAFAAGFSLGVFFFGGLWWTVNSAVTSEQPAFLFLGSLLVRMTITLTGFFLVGREHWERWLLCLLGFVLARIVVKSLIHASVESRVSGVPETHYAP